MAPAIMTLAAERPSCLRPTPAFMLICSALVLVMTPGLAFFYGGMVRVKSTLNMLMMSFISIGHRHHPVGAVRLLASRSAPATAASSAGLRLGRPAATSALTELWHGYTIPVFVFAVFQMMFAIITPALISGALADRVKFTAWALFVALWATVVYFPVAHWVWGTGGWPSSWVSSTSPVVRRSTSTPVPRRSA